MPPCSVLGRVRDDGGAQSAGAWQVQPLWGMRDGGWEIYGGMGGDSQVIGIMDAVDLGLQCCWMWVE